MHHFRERVFEYECLIQYNFLLKREIFPRFSSENINFQLNRLNSRRRFRFDVNTICFCLLFCDKFITF